jgi:hypothetical protein
MYSPYFRSYILTYEEVPSPTTEVVPPAVKPPETQPEKKFSQEDVNKLLAENKRTLKEQNESLHKQLTQLSESKNLTDQEKADLNSRIVELENTFKSKQQLAEEKAAKSEKKYAEDTKKLLEEGTIWKNRYVDENIVNHITNASVGAEAFSPEQIVSLLKPNSRLAEIKDETGNTIGFETKIKFRSKDKEDKIVDIELSPAQALEKMKEDAPKYGNLFKSNFAGGFSGNNANIPTTNADYDNMEHYAQQRKQGINNKNK